MMITPEDAKLELESVLGTFHAELESWQETHARSILIALNTLHRRLDQPHFIRQLYESEKMREAVPQSLYHLAIRYSNGQISREAAAQEIQVLDATYRMVLQEKGLKET